jgi:hypothetical protein
MATVSDIFSKLTYGKIGAKITWNGTNVFGGHLDITYGFLSKLPGYYSNPNPVPALGDTKDFITASQDKSVDITAFNGNIAPDGKNP